MYYVTRSYRGMPPAQRWPPPPDWTTSPPPAACARTSRWRRRTHTATMTAYAAGPRDGPDSRGGSPRTRRATTTTFARGREALREDPRTTAADVCATPCVRPTVDVFCRRRVSAGLFRLRADLRVCGRTGPQGRARSSGPETPCNGI